MMVSANVAFTAFLSTSPALMAALTPPNAAVPMLYSPRLAPGWKPSLGPAISHFVRGGPQPSLYTPIVQPNIQVTTWAATPKLARAVHSLAYAVVHGATNLVIATQDGDIMVKWSKADSYPQDVVDPETGWFTVSSFFEVAMILDL